MLLLFKNIRFVLIFLALLLSAPLGAQPQPADKVIFSYYEGGNSWGLPGIYGQGESIEFTKINFSSYRITRHYKITNPLAADSATYLKDTTSLQTNIPCRRIPRGYITALYKALNTNEDNFNTSFIISKLVKPTRQQIQAIAKKIDRSYLFEDDKESDSVNIRKIENFDKLGDFVKFNTPEPGHEIVVTDVAQGFSIKYIAGGDTVLFRGSLLRLLGQPVYKVQNGSRDGVINVNINIMISHLLPSLSLFKNAIDINRLCDRYIEWYLEKIL